MYIIALIRTLKAPQMRLALQQTKIKTDKQVTANN